MHALNLINLETQKTKDSKADLKLLLEKHFVNFTAKIITRRELSSASTNDVCDKILKISFTNRKLHLNSIYNECLYFKWFVRQKP
jgi:hypothetical protein